MKNVSHLGMPFIVDKNFLNADRFQKPKSNNLIIESLNKRYIVINCNAPINEDSQLNAAKVEEL